ncbi:unnamed protein product [Mortierella alpina]
MRFFSLANTFPLLLVVSFSTGDLFINSATAEDIPNNACGLQSAVLGSATSTPESAASPFHDTAPGMRTDPPSLNEGDFQPDQTSCTLCIDDFYDCRLQYYRVCQVSGRRGDTCRERFARHCHNEYEDCMANCEQPSQGVSDPNSQHGPLPPPPAPPEIQGDDQCIID